MGFLARRAVLVALVGCIALPTVAHAITVGEVLALSKAGVSEAVILALIDRDRTIFAIEPNDVVALQAQGLTDSVIVAMLRSGRDDGDRAARAASDLSTAMFLAERAPGPEVTIVGHDRDQPNPFTSAPYFGAPSAAPILVVPYAGGARWRRREGAPVPAPTFPEPAASTSPFHQPAIAPVSVGRLAFCRAEVRGANSAFPLTYTTVCPDVMQPKR